MKPGFRLALLAMAAFLGLTSICFLRAEEQPPYDVKDPAISENFRNIYLQADKLSLFSTLFTYNLSASSNVFCIDSPTFCVDATAHTISMSSTTLSGRIDLPVGSLTAPSLTFGGAATGISRPTANRLSFSIAGSENFRVDGTNGIEWITGTLTGADGSASSPAYGFNSEGGLGMYRSASGQLGFSVGSTLIARFVSTGANIDVGGMFLNDANNGALTASKTSNQLVLGTTTITLNAVAPATARVYTIPEVGSNAAFAFSNIFQTFTDSVTVSKQLIGGAVQGTSAPTNTQIGYSTYAVSGTQNIASNNTWQNLTQVTLGPGDWFVIGAAGVVLNTATATQSKLVISQNSGNTTTDHVFGDNQYEDAAPTASNNTSIDIPPLNIRVSAPTVVYLKGLVTFSAGTPQMSGKIFAWRPR